MCVSRWNQLDLAIVLLSIMGITLEEIDLNASLPINPTIIRIMRVLRITRGKHTGRQTQKTNKHDGVRLIRADMLRYFSAEAVKDGDGDESSVGHSDAGSASGKKHLLCLYS